MNNQIQGCGALATGGYIGRCGDGRGYICDVCLGKPVKLDDFAAEVTGGFLVVAIKVPTHECAACHATYTPDVKPGTVYRHHQAHRPISDSFIEPWCAHQPWVFVDNGKRDRDNRRALVCPPCARELVDARRLGQETADAAKARVAARIDWSLVRS